MREEGGGGGMRRRGGRGWEGEVGSKACVLSAKVATTFVSRRRGERRWHVDRIFTVKKKRQLDPVTGPGGPRGLWRQCLKLVCATSCRARLLSKYIWSKKKSDGPGLPKTYSRGAQIHPK